MMKTKNIYFMLMSLLVIGIAVTGAEMITGKHTLDGKPVVIERITYKTQTEINNRIIELQSQLHALEVNQDVAFNACMAEREHFCQEQNKEYMQYLADEIARLRGLT